MSYQETNGRVVHQKGANGGAYVIMVDMDGNPVEAGGGGGAATDLTPITDRQGEVSATPAANTILGRLKALVDLTGEAIAAPGVNTVLGRLKGLSDLFGTISTNPTANTVLGRLKDIHSAVSAPKFTTVTITNLTTAADGTTFTAFASLACEYLDVFNDTGTDLEYRRGTTGLTMIIPVGQQRKIYGLTNANGIQFKRKDSAVTQVIVRAEAYKI